VGAAGGSGGDERSSSSSSLRINMPVLSGTTGRDFLRSRRRSRWAGGLGGNPETERDIDGWRAKCDLESYSESLSR
jgi:hypothetical protein